MKQLTIFQRSKKSASNSDCNATLCPADEKAGSCYMSKIIMLLVAIGCFKLFVDTAQPVIADFTPGSLALAYYGYDTARDISRLTTVTLSIMSLWISYLWLQKKHHIALGKRIFTGFAITLATLIFVHLVGTFIINNTGGLSGGL
ncbi:MAG: hypothetical protein K2W82_12715 [Candidatus Obscuribacterales bacterium]|nr:hypothetical protein [Candidatus Obscuribacterales bacterium]